MSRLILVVALLALGESAYAQQMYIYQHPNGSFTVNRPGMNGGYSTYYPTRNGWNVDNHQPTIVMRPGGGWNCLPGYRC